MATKSDKALPAVQETDETQSPEMSVIEGGKVSRPRLQHIEPQQFAALRDELGFTNKDVAAAIGRTPSRVSELTKSQGASINVWNAYEAALRSYTPPQVEE